MHKAGKTNIADYISRTATCKAEEDTQLEAHVNVVIAKQLPDSISRHEIAQATLTDLTLQSIIKAITTKDSNEFGKPELKRYKGRATTYSVTNDGLLTTNDRIVIPESLQQKVLSVAHKSHQGGTKTYYLLKERVWFPRMKHLVEQTVKSCEACQIAKERIVNHPVLMHEIPDDPWDQVAVDFYGPMKEDNHYLLVLTDLYSRYPIVQRIKSVPGESVIPILDKIFKTFGYPRLIRSDNGAPFNGQEWQKFTRNRDILVEKTTPYHAQANGLVERFMKNLTNCRRVAYIYGKNYMDVIDDYIADYRSTPHSTTGKSPTSLIFKYTCNTSGLPQIKTVIKDNTNIEAEVKDRIKKIEMKANKERHGWFGCKNFKEGEEVRVKLATNQAKYIPPKTIETYRITKVHNTQITAERKNSDGTITTVTRDDSFFERTYNQEKSHTEPPVALPRNEKKIVDYSSDSDTGAVICIAHFDAIPILRQSENGQNPSSISHEEMVLIPPTTNAEQTLNNASGETPTTTSKNTAAEQPSDCEPSPARYELRERKTLMKQPDGSCILLYRGRGYSQRTRARGRGRAKSTVPDH